MEYNLIINDKTVPVDLDIEGENQLVISIEGTAYTVSYSRIDNHLLNLNINGKKVNAYVADTSEGREIFFDGKSYRVNDRDAMEQSGTKKSSGGKAADEITPPMPAVVVSVAVREGDTVEKGQGVVVVSAMKMETTLYAPFSGKVTAVSVQAGDKVMPGDILVDIEKQEEE